MSQPASPSPDSPRPDPEAVDLVRRRLLVAGGKYAAPAVLASLLMQRTAYAQQSCMPPGSSEPLPPDGGRPPGQAMM